MTLVAALFRHPDKSRARERQIGAAVADLRGPGQRYALSNAVPCMGLRGTDTLALGSMARPA